jgi:pyruvate dehydrogenase E2 component (dihydrolipoamide acetyltransferase)
MGTMSNPSSSFEVVMPRLGLTMTEAKIVEWLKQEGAWVDKGENLFVLESEKATLEIESPASGQVHILVPVGQVVPILTPIAVLEGSRETALHQTEKLEQPSPRPPRGEIATGGPHTFPTAGGRLRASPRARALARQKGIPLAELPGSGVRGMVVVADLNRITSGQPVQKLSPVAQRLAAEKGIDLTSVHGSGPHGQVMRSDLEKAGTSSPRPASSPDLSSLTGLRALIANRLSASWVERPQVTLITEVDATALVALRSQIQTQSNVKVSYNAFLLKLVAQALLEHPRLNVRLTALGLQQLAQINIGLAVDTERGLLVPVVTNVDQKPLLEVDEELVGLIQRATDGRSLPDELTGGTFTVTNLGMYEIDAFTPIINPPECAILGVGRIASKPVGVEGQIALRERMALSLSFDHRLVDGGPAAQFLQRVKTLLEGCAALGFLR